ncbi:MAG: hypothetical protein IKX88_02945 [Thermoguttaceae bacterium]|nr:hypothetical protein [Thermoguttaceae bacterium]
MADPTSSRRKGLKFVAVIIPCRFEGVLSNGICSIIERDGVHNDSQFVTLGSRNGNRTVKQSSAFVSLSRFVGDSFKNYGHNAT